MSEVKQTTTVAEPVCVACVGDRVDADGELCKRCRGSGRDPDPMAPTGIPVAS